jgi:hypothetical protein
MSKGLLDCINYPGAHMFSTTKNGATTLITSGDALIDFFFRLGASRERSEEAILKDFTNAWTNEANRLYTLKALFYARDIRGGQGERRLFRICLKWLAENEPEVVRLNLHLISEYGRWDDLMELLEFPLLEYFVFNEIKEGIKRNDRLLFKWLPREGSARNKLAAKIRKHLMLSPKEYRKFLVAGTHVVETQMCAHQWTQIEYSHVPSRAMHIYSKTFQKRDGARYTQYLTDLTAGKTKVNAGTLYPYEIITPFQYDTPGEPEQSLAAAQWAALPNYVEKGHSMIAVCDVSGSMNGRPMMISVSLGMYLAERNTGPFAGKFITFTNTPTLISLEGTLSENIETIMSHVGYNTDMTLVFKCILDAAKAANAKQEDLPKTILVISDMEFDIATGISSSYRGVSTLTHHNIIDMYAEAGYEPPQMVYWNVNALSDSNLPVGINEENVALVSGFSPSIMKAILAADDFSPIGIAMQALDNIRYAAVKLT